MAHPSHLCGLPLIVRAQVLILIYCVRPGSYTVEVAVTHCSFLNGILVSDFACLRYAKEGLLVLGFEHRLTLPACHFITVQRSLCLLWSRSCTQILIHISGKECLLQRDENIRIIFFSALTNKTFLIHSSESHHFGS